MAAAVATSGAAGRASDTIGTEGFGSRHVIHPLDPLTRAEVEAAGEAVRRLRPPAGSPAPPPAAPPAGKARTWDEDRLEAAAPVWGDRGGLGVPVERAFASLPQPRVLRFVSLELAEPAKARVLALPATAAQEDACRLAPRMAVVQYLEVYGAARKPTGQAFEALVQLPPLGGAAGGAAGGAGRLTASTATVVAARQINGGQPAMSEEEYGLIEKAVKADPQVAAAMAKRGVRDMGLLMVDPWCVGLPTEGEAADDGRFSRPIFWVKASEDDDNGYARPVVGLEVVVDTYTMELVSIVDLDEEEGREPVPVPPADPLRHWTRRHTRGDWPSRALKPLHITQPQGPSWCVSGQRVDWQRWSFRVGWTAQEGLVLHTVAYADPRRAGPAGEGSPRPVAYRLSYAEMIVPYGDPRSPHVRKNAFDAGEDGLGRNAHSLTLGCDCLGTIHYFDANVVTGDGGARVIKNAICLHEEDYGTLWKHQDWRDRSEEVRRARRLVISFIATVANYEYKFAWHFYQSGDIESEVTLSGVLSTGAERPGDSPPWGTMLTPDGLYAPTHQHFWVVRLDMAVDGVANSLTESEIVADVPGPENIYRGAFRSVSTALPSEAVAQRDCNHFNGRTWLVSNAEGRTNRVGDAVGWKLIPGGNCGYGGREDSAVMARAGFLRHHVWATQYRPDELYPAGPFPNQNLDEGVAFMASKRDASLDAEDIVLWYLFGIAHVPRLEDWPIVAMERVSFKLSPAGFFDCSPAIDVPPQEAIQGGGSSECGGGGGECGAAAGGAGSAKACCKEEGHACSRSRL